MADLIAAGAEAPPPLSSGPYYSFGSERILNHHCVLLLPCILPSSLKSTKTFTKYNCRLPSGREGAFRDGKCKRQSPTVPLACVVIALTFANSSRRMTCLSTTMTIRPKRPMSSSCLPRAPSLSPQRTQMTVRSLLPYKREGGLAD
jgi:hypothetical protein